MPRPLIHRFLTLPAPDRRLFLHASWLLLKQRLSLAWHGRRAVGAMVAEAMGPPVGIADAARARRLLVSFERAARHHLFPCNCLLRSLAGRRMLAAHNIAARLRIGVAPGGAVGGGQGSASLRAHAWLEVGGEVVNDDPAVADRFAALPEAAALPTPDRFGSALRDQ